MPLIIPDSITIEAHETVVVALFTEISNWGFKSQLNRHHLVTDLYLILYLKSGDTIAFYNVDGIIVAHNKTDQFDFPMSSPTLFADQRSFVKSQLNPR